MKSLLEVECLACGSRRQVTGGRPDEVGECLRCGYVGWAPAQALDDGERAVLQKRLGRLNHERGRVAWDRL